MSLIFRMLLVGALMVAAAWTLLGVLQDLVEEDPGDDVDVLVREGAADVGEGNLPPYRHGYEDGYTKGHHEGLRTAARAVTEAGGVA